MKHLSVFRAALIAAGGNPDAKEYSSEELAATRDVLRDVDAVIGDLLGEDVIHEVTIGGEAAQ